ncbi:MAG: tail fiber domain-containing protein, partial [Candidatus Omnitrophota bacterium]
NQMMFSGTNAAFAIRYNGTSGSWDQRRLSVVTGVGAGDGSGGTEAFTVTNNGNVGIRTIAPTVPLEINTTGTAIKSPGDIRLGEWASNTGGTIYFDSYPSGRITSSDTSHVNAMLIDSAFHLALRTHNLGATIGSISFYPGDGNAQIGQMSDTLFFYRGNMAVGTTIPLARLTVAGGIRANKGNPTPANNGANVGYAFEEDGDTGMFSVGGNTHTGSDLIFKIDTGEHMRIVNGHGGLGTVGIGTSDPQGYRLYVNGTAYSTGGWQGSDIKFKKNISDIDGPLEKLLKIRGVIFEWKTDEFKDKGFPSGRHYGVIAQEIEKVFPEVVKTGSNGEKAVSYTELVPILIEAMKAQEQEIQTLKQEVNQLKKKQ